MFRIISSIVILGAFCIGALAQTTTFTYQGRLTYTGSPTTNYDFEFRLWDALTGGNLLATQAQANVPVTNGVFSVKVDLSASFSSGAPRYLEIGVKNVGGGSFTTLSPRQQVTSAPYNIRSLSAANADQLGGISASGLIQNRTSQQPSSNFNISGNGIIGGNLGIGTAAPVGNLHINVPGSGNPISALTLDVGTFGTPGNAVNSHYFKVRDIGSGGAPAFLIRGDGNVGIGTSSPAATLEVNGYTKLGSDAPSIRVKKLSGTTAATEGALVVISHGLDQSKILSVSVMVSDNDGVWVPASYLGSNGRHFSWNTIAGVINVVNVFGQSAVILSRPIKIIIIYEQ